MAVRVLLSPDGEGQGGSGTEEGKEPTKTFTQADVDKIVADRVKKLTRENQTLNTNLTKLQEQFEELKKSLEKPKEPEPEPTDFQGQIKLIQERHRREVEGLQTQVNKLSKDLEEQTRLRLNTQRDKILESALIKAGCIDLKIGTRTFLPQVVYDEVDNIWQFNLTGGGTVSVEDGIEEELPDFLRRPRSAGSGSGSSNHGGGKTSAALKVLEAEEVKLAKFEEIAKNSGRHGDVMQYQTQKRKVQELKASLEKK